MEDLEKILDPLGGKIIAYMDDMYLLTKDNISNELDLAQKGLEKWGLVLNRSKSTTYSIQDLQTSPKGLEALGSYIGLVQARRTFLNKKIT